VVAATSALVVAGLIAVGTAGPVHAVAPRCGITPAPAADIASVPWPQLRYDLAQLSQISDGRGVTVAVVDSGVDARHPQLRGRVRKGSDLLDASGDGRLDCVGHGTAVASIIAAGPAEQAGLRGLAAGVSILPIRVSERVEADGTVSGRGLDAAGLADGLRAAIAHGAMIVNVSISVARDDPTLRRAVEDALAADVVIVAAVGNQHDRGDPTPYPAAYPGVVGVGSIGPDGARAAASQVGSYVDIVAPGEGVVGAVPGQGHIGWSGTSFATPFVSATAALIRAHRPELRQADVVRRLLATTDPAPARRPSPEYGSGVLNPIRAVTEVLPSAPTIREEVQRSAGSGPTPANTGPAPALGRALAIASALVTAALVIGVSAAAVPMGRRRRWRPGRRPALPATAPPAIAPPAMAPPAMAPPAMAADDAPTPGTVQLHARP